MIKDEVFYLSRHGNIGSLQSVSKLPTWERRYYLFKLNDEYEKQKEEIEKIRRRNSNSGMKKR